MEIRLCETPAALGTSAARHTAFLLNQAICEHGAARLLLSTGASQFDTLAALVEAPVEWEKVEMFHLDEYVGIAPDHPASFQKYLRERFVERVPLKKAHFVDGDPGSIARLTQEIRSAPVDVGLIGVGENTHIAFNDPPADFDTDEAYILVELDETCKRQQCGEGWFDAVEHVPAQALSMTVRQIMRCRHIVSCVPYGVKAKAVRRMLTESVNNLTPATMLRRHPNMVLYVDRDSFAQMLAREPLWNA